MNINDYVMVNINKNLITPEWVAGVIKSIYITPKTNFYLVLLNTNEYVTIEEQYIKESVTNGETA